jgi:transposase, IS5 family
MYRRATPGQLSFENFYLPFGGKLSGENRWVKMSDLIPWEAFEAEYAAQLSEGMGALAKSFRIALGGEWVGGFETNAFICASDQCDRHNLAPV